jgi:hypothetical protein
MDALSASRLQSKTSILFLCCPLSLTPWMLGGATVSSPVYGVSIHMLKAAHAVYFLMLSQNGRLLILLALRCGRGTTIRRCHHCERLLYRSISLLLCAYDWTLLSLRSPQ